MFNKTWQLIKPPSPSAGLSLRGWHLGTVKGAPCPLSQLELNKKTSRKCLWKAKIWVPKFFSRAERAKLYLYKTQKIQATLPTNLDPYSLSCSVVACHYGVIGARG